MASSNAVYLGPLRLLAHEVARNLNTAGKPTSLVTGEERVLVENAQAFACTVEMADLSRKFDVAVIDEIQLLADPHRGWAWTNAVLGLQAKELHLCGEPTAVNLVQLLAEECGETVEVVEYKRLLPLVISPSLSGSLKKVQKGDCVVTFSRVNIFQLKNFIESTTGLKCAVVYGSLPAETRQLQASLFNDPDSDWDVLVASDAIGLGLNLNIQRIIFDRMEKFDGDATRQLTPSQVKQIAGRAGRYSSHYNAGQ
ncbi:RNA helicase, partial [Gonapodya sp. JEL0774]